MMRNILVILLIIYLSLQFATSQPVELKSFVHDINFEYKNDEWTCGTVKCPPNTFGCKIVKKTFEDHQKELYLAYNCMDNNKNFTEGAGGRIELVKGRNIHIVLDTFLGAESGYSIIYGIGGNERAVGVIAVDQLNKFKDEFKNIVNTEMNKYKK